MTHDPLCANERASRVDLFYCECNLIARVRNDTLDAAVAAVWRICGHTKYVGCAPCAHDDAVTAITALRPAEGGAS